MDTPALIILFADDDPDDYDLLKEALLQVAPPHILHHVNRGDEVMAAAKEHPPDLIFLDYNMPGCDGAQCLQVIKADHELHNIPVIMYSTSSATTSLTECYKLGAARYMVKPVTYSGIFKGLEVIFQLHKSGQLIRPSFDQFVMDTYKMQ
jgi:CheY-like chemotaxis protein